MAPEGAVTLSVRWVDVPGIMPGLLEKEFRVSRFWFSTVISKRERSQIHWTPEFPFVPDHTDSALAEPPAQETVPEKREKQRKKHKRQPPYHVILWNDDDHSYQYVIDLLAAIFGHTAERGYQLAKEVDTQGRTIVYTTTLERAELKRDQIHAFGKDRAIAACKGSMKATLEAAE